MIMNMDITAITTMLGTILGIITPLGGVGAWLYRKQNKRLKEAEAALAEANVSKAKIETISRSVIVKLGLLFKFY